MAGAAASIGSRIPICPGRGFRSAKPSIGNGVSNSDLGTGNSDIV